MDLPAIIGPKMTPDFIVFNRWSNLILNIMLMISSLSSVFCPGNY